MGFRLSTPLTIVGIALLYFLSARLGLLLSFGISNATPVWPPSGLAVAALVIFGYRITPGIWFGAFAANLVVFLGNHVGDVFPIVLLSATIATGNMGEAVLAKFLLNKVMGGKKSFVNYQQVFWFAAICIPSALVSSLIGVGSLIEWGIVPFENAVYTWQTWFLGDISGIVILAPFLLFIGDRRNDSTNFFHLEFVLNLAFVQLFTIYLFVDGDGSIADELRLKAYLLIPFLIWGAFRFTQREMSVLLLSISAVVVYGTVNGSGPFAGSDLNQSLLELQSFTTIITISFLALSATLFEQKKIRSRIEENSGKLEQRVLERTQALTNKIAQLEKTEAELAVIKQEFVKACEIAHLGHFQWDTINDTLFWSDQVYEIFGVDKRTFEASFAAYSDLLHPMDREKVNGVLQEAYRTHEPYSMYHRIINPGSNAVKWVHSKGSVSVNASGAVSKMTGTVLDITELKEKELFSDHLVSIIQHSTDAIISFSVDGTVISWNKSGEDLMGLSSEELIGNNIFDFVQGKSADDLKERIEKVKNGEVVTVDDLVTIPDGTKLNLWITYSPILDIDGKVSSISVIMRNITERKEQEDNRFKLIVDSAPNVMLLLNEEGCMEIVNTQVETMLGYSQSELIGKPLDILVPERFKNLGTDNSTFVNPFAGLTGKGKDLYVLHKSGLEIPVEIGLNPIETPDGNIVLVAITDITERKKIDEAHREQEIAKETVRLKDQFMANMSHEIRTPMNAIIGFTDLLDRSDLRAEQKEYLNAIKSSGNNLLIIINDILDLSKIHSGTVQLERTPMSVTDIGHNICEIFGQRAKEKGLELRCVEKPEKPVVVWGDPVRLSQILMNLISNAVKFTEKGFVEAGIRIISEDKKHQTLEFFVRDSGIGIPHGKIDNIFDRFTQASSDTTRKYGGTGLGLSIVKGLVEIQGGTLQVESTLGEGSTFRFRIRYDRYIDPDQQHIKFNSMEASELNVSIVGLKILLVEDNRLNQKLATTVLLQAGCEVDIAETGQDAVETPNLEKYDAILMDIQMPIMDGYKATQILRTEKHLKVPIIAMTAHAMAGERDKCLSLGMTDYLSKPFQREQLIRIIHDNLIKAAV